MPYVWVLNYKFLKEVEAKPCAQEFHKKKLRYTCTSAYITMKINIYIYWDAWLIIIITTNYFTSNIM